MHIQFIYLFVTLIFTSLIYPFWINFVYKYHLGEEIRGDGPKSHILKRGTPTIGGFVFIFTVSLVTFVFNRSRTQTLFPVFVASMAGLFGLIEDFSKIYKRSELQMLVRKKIVPVFVSKSSFYKLLLKPWDAFKEFWRLVGSSTDMGLQTYQKFLIQAFIGGFVALWTYFKLGWDYIWFPLVGNVHIGVLYPVLIFLLFIIVLNSVAFTDGLDGLAGGLSVIAFCAFWVIANALGYNSLAMFCATFVGAMLPFLYFNVYPARIFMGNVGSHVLGAALAILAVVLHREIALFFIVLVFLVDGFTSPLQQLSVKLTGKRLLRMAPIHHHFELLGWPETKVVLRLWLFGAVSSLFGILVALM